MAAKSIRKSVSFDDSDEDRDLLDAIATHQAEQQQTFSDLCKQALRQYLLGQDANQSAVMFMELQQQIAQLTIRVAALEANSNASATAIPDHAPKTELAATPVPASEPTEETDDPVLSRLGPLLDEF